MGSSGDSHYTSQEEEVCLALFGLKERPDLVGRRVEHLERASRAPTARSASRCGSWARANA